MKASSPTSRSDHHQATATVPHGEMIAASQANAVPAACPIGLVEDQCRSGVTARQADKALSGAMVRATAKGLPSGSLTATRTEPTRAVPSEEPRLETDSRGHAQDRRAISGPLTPVKSSFSWSLADGDARSIRIAARASTTS